MLPHILPHKYCNIPILMTVARGSTASSLHSPPHVNFQLKSRDTCWVTFNNHDIGPREIEGNRSTPNSRRLKKVLQQLMKYLLLCIQSQRRNHALTEKSEPRVYHIKNNKKSSCIHRCFFMPRQALRGYSRIYTRIDVEYIFCVNLRFYPQVFQWTNQYNN